MQGQLLCTTVVGSYPQPDWLIDRRMLGSSVPRVPARELWRIPDEFLEQAQDDATLLAVILSATAKPAARATRIASQRPWMVLIRLRLAPQWVGVDSPSPSHGWSVPFGVRGLCRYAMSPFCAVTRRDASR